MQKYEVNGIPSLIAVSIDGQVISKHGRSEVTEKGMVVKVLIQKRSYTWSRLIKTKYL